MLLMLALRFAAYQRLNRSTTMQKQEKLVADSVNQYYVKSDV